MKSTMQFTHCFQEQIVNVLRNIYIWRYTQPLGYIVSLNPLELGTRVSLSHRQPYVSILAQVQEN